jgi:hypothetical protein
MDLSIMPKRNKWWETTAGTGPLMLYGDWFFLLVILSPKDCWSAGLFISSPKHLHDSQNVFQ